MTITLLCSCGLLLEHGGQKLLVDAPNGTQEPFYELPDTALQKLIAAQPPFDGALALAFTHTHPDHFCGDKLRRVLDARPQLQVFLPDAATPDAGKLRLGGFTLEFHRFAHTPVPEDLMTEHFVLLISYGGRFIYITSDAAPDVLLHRSVLAGRRCSAAFWNGQYLSHAHTRALLQEAAERNFVYHVPVDASDVSGVRRKCERNLRRFADELGAVTVLDRYPAQISL